MRKEERGETKACKLTWNQLKDVYNFDQTCSSQKALSLLCGVNQRQKVPVKKQSDVLSKALHCIA